MDCRTFRDQIVHFQADEVAEGERQALQEHLNGCAACARRLTAEEVLLATLRRGLTPTPAPPELADRIRGALEAEAAGDATEPSPATDRGDALPSNVVRHPAWYRRPWLVAAAAVVLLAVVLWPVVSDRGPVDPGQPIRIVEQAVVVVDADCERGGKTPQEQRGCRHPKHFNQLKLSDGDYWNVSLDDEAGREVVLTAEMRGQHLLVEGDLYPAIQTLRLRRFEVLDASHVRHGGASGTGTPRPGAGVVTLVASAVPWR